MSEMCGWLVGLPAPAPACMCGVEGSRPQPLTQASVCVKRNRTSGEARAALTISNFDLRSPLGDTQESISTIIPHSWNNPSLLKK